MDRPTCETCLYWRQWANSDPLGDCRRFPPTPLYEPGPVDVHSDAATCTARDYWCGEHPEMGAYIASLKPKPAGRMPAEIYCQPHMLDAARAILEGARQANPPDNRA